MTKEKELKRSQASQTQARPLKLGRYHGEILLSYDDPAFLDALASPENLWRRAEARLLLDSRNRLSAVRLRLSSGREIDIVVKEFFPRGLIKLKSLIQPSRAERAWRGTLALLEKGIDTPSPVGYLEARRGWLSWLPACAAVPALVEHGLFLAEEIKRAEEIRTLFRTLDAADLRPLLTRLAGHLLICHERGILHRDLSDGNILVEKAENGAMKFYLIDTTRVRLCRQLGRFRRIKNLIRLGIPASLQSFFLSEYFRLAGWQDSAALRLWYRINKMAFHNYIALKRKLGLRKIARRLKIQ